MIILEEKLLHQMEKDAEHRYPEECCGILIGRRIGLEKRLVEEVYPTINEAGEGQERQFLINPLTLLAAEKYAAKNGKEIIGFYHSHPDCQAQASTEDERCALPDCSYPILAVSQGEVCDIQSWVLNDFQFQREIIQYREEGDKTICQ